MMESNGDKDKVMACTDNHVYCNRAYTMLIPDLVKEEAITMNYLTQNVAKTSFVEQLKLAEKAQEDIYFAKTNRELLEDLHRQVQALKDDCRSVGSQPLFNARTPFEKGRETKRTKCLGIRDT